MDVEPTEPVIELQDDLEKVSLAQTALADEIRALSAALCAESLPCEGCSVTAPLSDVDAAVSASARSLPMPGLLQLPGFDSTSATLPRDRLLPPPLVCDMHVQSSRTCTTCLTIRAERALFSLQENSSDNLSSAACPTADSGVRHRDLYPSLEFPAEQLYDRVAVPGVRGLPQEHTFLAAKSIAAGHQRRLHLLKTLYNVFLGSLPVSALACRISADPNVIDSSIREVLSLYRSAGISLVNILHCSENQLLALCCPELTAIMPSFDDSFTQLSRKTHHLFLAAGDCIAVQREHHGLGSITDHIQLADGLPVHLDGADAWHL